MLTCLGVEHGVADAHADSQADTCRNRKPVNMRLTGVVQCQALVSGQEHQVRRKTNGLFQAFARRTMENIERGIDNTGNLCLLLLIRGLKGEAVEGGTDTWC